MNPLSSADLDTAIALGVEDRAVLDRLRTIALLLRAGAAAQPDLDGIDIGLWTDHTGTVYPLKNTTAVACRRLAHAAGRPDLLGTPPFTTSRRLYDTHLRTALAEFPNGCPPALFALLNQLRIHRRHTPAAPSAFLAAAGWIISSRGNRAIVPLLPTSPSALEVLDLLAVAEGLGQGPLGILAAQVAARLSWDVRP